MSTLATTDGSCNNGSSAKTEDKAPSSDNGSSAIVIASGSASASGSSSSSSSSSNDNMNIDMNGEKILVSDFIRNLAKEANIANMTVETNDGRRISATFEHAIATGTPTPGSVSTSNHLDPSTALDSSTISTDDVSKDNASDQPSNQTSDNSNGKDEKATFASPTRDIATTMAMMGAEKTAPTPSSLPTPGLEPYAPQDWAINYQNKHVAVTYSSTGDIPSLTNGSVHKTNGTSASGVDNTTTSLPPKKRAAVKTEEGSSDNSARTDWNAMSALVDAAYVAEREREQVPPGVAGIGGSAAKVTTAMATGTNIPTTAFKKKANKRKPRKIIPEVKEYVQFTQNDILFGRGGRSNHHPGNKTYREIVTNQQNHYRGCDKNEKTKVAQGIVDHVHNVVGGRFLELDRDAKRWFLVPNVVARRKVGQALRENNTEEARAAKRAKYQGRLNSKKKNSTTDEGDKNMSSNGTVPMIGTVPMVDINGSSNPNVFPIVAAETTNDSVVYPIDEAESSNGVAV